MVRATMRIDAQLSPPSWTSLAADISAADPVTWTRGLGGPLEHVALPGTLEWTMRNHAGNSVATEGAYSPNHASCRSGWGFGIAVRVVLTYSAVDYVVWRGKLRSIAPIPGKYGPRRVKCVAVDYFSELAETDVRAVTPQAEKTENELFAVIYAAMPSWAQPVATTYGSAVDLYPYAFDNASSNVKALGLVQAVATSAQAWVYPLGDGTIHHENRQAREAEASAYSFAETEIDQLEVPSDLSRVFTRVRATTHPRTVDGALSVLFAITDPIEVAAGATVEIWGDYRQETSTTRLIGGTGQVTSLVSGTDYIANDLRDDSGSVRTSDVTITATAYAASAKFEIENTSGSTLFLTTLQIRGQAITDDAPQSVEAVSVSADVDRLLDIDLPYQSNLVIAEALAGRLLDLYETPANQVLSFGFNPQRSAALMGQALSREIGDVVTLTETMTGISSAQVVIHQITMTWSHGADLRVVYGVAPKPADAFWSTAFSATGGTMTTSGGYTYHTFTTVGAVSFVVSAGPPTVVEYLIVGGGGAGGAGAGGAAGGGAGGEVKASTMTVGAGTFTGTVGDGGTAVASDQGNPGGASTFNGVSAAGGSGGGCGGAGGNQDGGSGVLGGGAGDGGSRGTGTLADGGDAGSNGGGGGAGALPQVGASWTGGAVGGAGGAGKTWARNSTVYGGGGGGAGSTTGGSGGSGGGGAGRSGTGSGTSGTANLGGGGGGSRFSGSGGSGGKGVVIIAYPTP
jgi:hypothetical protein